MVYEYLLKPEMLTAMSVFLGALFAGVVAVIAELRKPDPEPRSPSHGSPRDGERPAAPCTEAVCACLREEADHIARTVWIVEKKLSDHLHRIELGVARGGAARIAIGPIPPDAPAEGSAGEGGAVPRR